MLFPTKKESQIFEEMMAELEQTTGINDNSPGAIARSILEVINRKLNSFYRYFDEYAAMIFVSVAEGDYLDMIGQLLNCTRLPTELDHNYRYRITNQAFSAAAANRTAIRLKCLSIPGVKDIIMTPFTRGSGSFTVHVITDELDTPEAIMQQVRSAVLEIKAEGVRAIISKPLLCPIDLEFSAALQSRSNTPMESASLTMKEQIKDHVDKIGIGEPIFIQKIMAIAMLSQDISEVYLTSFKINEEPMIIRDRYQLNWDERPYLRDVKVNIIGS